MNYTAEYKAPDMPKNIRVAVIGGGNIGTQAACVCAAKGYSVCVHTSKPGLYDGVLEIADEAGNITKGRIDKATSEIGEAVKDCDIILVCHPAFMLQDTARQILPYIRRGTQICVFPGTGGTEFAFDKCVQAGAVLNGLQRLLSVARLEQYGKRVRCEGLRKELFLASRPKDGGRQMTDFLSSLWEIPCTVLPNYLNVTRTPSNPILHTTRLKTLFADYEPGKVYDRNPLFYGEWSDASSKLLLACDDELQAICKALEGLDLRAVRSLKV